LTAQSVKSNHGHDSFSFGAIYLLTPTDFVELESVKDTFLDLGKTLLAKLPDAITSWTPTQTDSSIQLVGYTRIQLGLNWVL
jgi:hypothetical protein